MAELGDDEWDFASAATTVKVNVPMDDGFPDITPLEFNFMPGGSADPLLSDHLYGALPPAAVSEVSYDSPRSAFGSATVVT